MKTVIYARKSRGTEEELSSQVSMCKDYCDKNNYDIAEIFSEIRSSQDFERKQYTALKDYIAANTHVRVMGSLIDQIISVYTLSPFGPENKVAATSFTDIPEDVDDDFLDEVCGFPAMEHDEFVDILGYAINDLYEEDDDMDYENIDKSMFGL